MNDVRRTHPLSIFAPIALIIKALFFPLMIAVFVGSAKGFAFPILVVGLSVLSVLTGLSFLSWKNTSYEQTATSFRLRRGFLNKQEIHLPVERILGIGTEQSLMQRVFGVVVLRLETLGTTEENEISLWLSKHRATEIQESLFPRDEKKSTIRSLSILELLFMGATSTSAFIGFGMLFGAYSQVTELFPSLGSETKDWTFFMAIPTFFDSLDVEFSPALFFLALGSVFVFLLLSWVVGTVTEAFRHANYQIERKEDKIHLSYGLINRKEAVVPVSRIQSVIVQESPLRQFIGRAAISIESTGYGGESGSSSLLFPFLRVDEVETFIQVFLPEFEREYRLSQKTEKGFLSHQFYLVTPFLLGVAALSLFIPYAYWSMILLPWVVYRGSLSHRDTGVALTVDMIVLRDHLFSRRTMFIPVSSVQSFSFSTHRLHERNRLIDLEVSIASDQPEKTFTIHAIRACHQNEILDWHQAYRKNKPTK